MNNKSITSKDAIRKIMKLRGWTQEQLATESGMKYQSNITGILNRGVSMRVDILNKLTEAMGYEIVLRDKMGSKTEWIINDIPDKESDDE